MYRCSNCGGEMNHPHDKCPHCGVWLSGVRCENCKYVGTKNEFISNKNRCPKCNSIVNIPRTKNYPNEEMSEVDNGIPLKNVLIFLGVSIAICVFILFGFRVLNNALEKRNEEKYGLFTDPRDNNTYRTIKIGSQEWMVENLKARVDKFGDTISLITNSTHWADLTSIDRACFYSKYRDSLGYGLLYTFAAVEDICPIGWHLPTDEEWKILTDYLGGAKRAGRKLKAAGTKKWAFLNIGANNKTGFTALPSGYHIGEFHVNMGYTGYWWSATEDDNRSAWIRKMHHGTSIVRKESYSKKYGLCVRCLKD